MPERMRSSFACQEAIMLWTIIAVACGVILAFLLLGHVIIH